MKNGQGAGDPLVERSIEARGIIGDQHTAALVADDGAIDFLCWPNFDSPTIFAGLLDRQRGGEWAIFPALDGFRRRQMYLPDTNLLQTCFSGLEGVGEIIDFMPIPEPGAGPRLVRRVHVVRGEICFRLRCAPRLDYARAETRASPQEENSVFFRAAGQPTLRLWGTVPFHIEPEEDGDAAVTVFKLRRGEVADFLLSDTNEEPPRGSQVDDLVSTCVAFWRNWVAKMTYRGRWREIVARSALLLKLLTSRQHGSVIAAVTMALPEAPGGPRNWDYRATWIRDASFTVYAFMRLGYVHEANAFMHWIERRGKGEGSDGSVQVMYGLDGREHFEEIELSHLRGHGGASPVRIGNSAVTQFQLDIYGELLDAGYLTNKYGDAISHDAWMHTIRAVDYVCEHWREPDQGIWEIRGAPRCWLHSRLMCWVALDRALRLAQKRSLSGPLARWQQVRDAVSASIWDEFWDDELGHFVAAQGGSHLDAAMLLMPLVRFVSATDPRWIATLEAIERELMEDPLVYRYRVADGLDEREGAFTACSFWYAECLARAGRLAEARLVFEKMLGYANPLGLYSEEIGLSGEQLGNTPQALSHLALISAAVFLDRVLPGSGSSGQPGSATWRP